MLHRKSLYKIRRLIFRCISSLVQCSSSCSYLHTPFFFFNASVWVYCVTCDLIDVIYTSRWIPSKRNTNFELRSREHVFHLPANRVIYLTTRFSFRLLEKESWLHFAFSDVILFRHIRQSKYFASLQFYKSVCMDVTL